MWKFAVIFLLAVLCVNAEEEKPTNNGQQTSSIVHTVLCYVSPKPLDCVKEQAGRMLEGWEQIVETKRHELLVEADEEIKKSETSRDLSEDEEKEKPSEVMGDLEKGLSAIANMMTDEFNVLRGRESRASKKQLEDDDTNDFNEDYSMYDAFSKAQSEGKLTEEARAKKLSKQVPGTALGYDDDGGFGGYNGYRGKGKKGKKHKKGMMKIFFLGAIVKSKVELLLRILSFHLQLKFFAIALASLMINLARFWIDVKKQPQKVVYVEHAQHQHHYDEHDDWGTSWKRQSPTQEFTQDRDFAHRLAYNTAPQYPQH